MSAYETEAYAHETESEAEQEAFFNHLAAAADRTGRSQSLRRVAIAAAKEAFRGASKIYPAVEGEFENELEAELEGEGELESLVPDIRPGAALALMEHMAHESSNAESESEAAEQFLPLIPLAMKALMPLAMKALPVLGKVGAKFGGKLLGKVAPKLLKKISPNLTRGVSQLARGLFRNKTTRPLIRAVPTIARRTVTSLAKRAAAGKPVTPQTAARLLAQQTKRVISNPRQLQSAYQRSQRADGVYHQQGPTKQRCSNCGGSAPVRPPRPAFTAVPQPVRRKCQCFRAVACASCGR